MKRREMLFALIGIGSALPPFNVFSQTEKPTAGVKRIGLLVNGSLAQRGHLDKALVDGLREQGYVEGRNLVIERRYADGGGTSKLREIARELNQLQLDAVVTTCTPSTRSMKEVTSSTPIVMAVVSDPVGQGLIASLARPGNNITGTSSQVEDVIPKMLEYFAAVLPRRATVAVLADKRSAVHPRLWELAEKSGVAMQLKLVRYEVAKTPEIDDAIASAAREGAHGLFVLPDHPLFLDQRTRILAAAAAQRLPGFFWAREFVEEGGLMSYGENIASGWGRSAVYVRRIMTGTKPADLPVSQPTNFELIINLETARKLGVTIPQSLRLRADKVIE